jgi:alpha-galactosidase
MILSRFPSTPRSVAVQDRKMKVGVIGASGWYAFDLYRRVFSDPRMQPIELRLWNRNPRTGEAVAGVLEHVRDQSGATGVEFGLYDDRREALRDVDYVLFAACVDYPRTRVVDTEVCERHGVYPLEAETMTPGGLMNCLRHVPIALDVARDLEAVAPNAVIIPVSNPLARICDALNRHSTVRFIGHCDGIIHTKVDLCTAMGLDPNGVEVVAGGVNHLTFIMKMWDKSTGEDLLPRIDEALPHIRQNGPFGFRFSNAVYRLMGVYPSPGDNHIADQLPFVSRAMQETTPIPKLDVAFPPAEIMKAGQALNANSVAGAAERIKDPELLKSFLNPSRTEETGDWMLAMHGRAEAHRFEAVNIANDGHIGNLPANSIVEVPAVIDTQGARGLAIGNLPPAAASLCLNMLVAHEAAVEACVSQSREAALQSLAFEPTVQDLYVVEDLLDDLLDANKQYLSDDLYESLRRPSGRRVELVEPDPSNTMVPGAPGPEGIPEQDVLVGAAWGSNLGNLAD